jgi:HAD superfamily hydrolase (TIGR01509 family)
MPVRAVLFDFSCTLFVVEDARRWLAKAAAALDLTLGEAAAADLTERLLAAGRPGGPFPPAVPDDLRDSYERRDLDGRWHREAYVGLMATAGCPDPRLPAALYARLTDPDGWVPYPDAEPVLAELARREVPVAVVTNTAFDPWQIFAAYGLDRYVAAYVCSCDVGMTKPDPEIFRIACGRLGVSPAAALMVGDETADAGAVRAGARVLLLPPSPPGRPHGLSAVLDLLDGK